MISNHRRTVEKAAVALAVGALLALGGGVANAVPATVGADSVPVGDASAPVGGSSAPVGDTSAPADS
jgi:hypothetical protein